MPRPNTLLIERLRKEKSGQLLCEISWLDSTHCGEWVPIENIQEHCNLCKSVGWVIGVTDESITITPNKTLDNSNEIGHVCGVLNIPLEMIQTITPIPYTSSPIDRNWISVASYEEVKIWMAVHEGQWSGARFDPDNDETWTLMGYIGGVYYLFDYFNDVAVKVEDLEPPSAATQYKVRSPQHHTIEPLKIWEELVRWST